MQHLQLQKLFLASLIFAIPASYASYHKRIPQRSISHQLRPGETVIFHFQGKELIGAEIMYEAGSYEQGLDHESSSRLLSLYQADTLYTLLKKNECATI